MHYFLIVYFLLDLKDAMSNIDLQPAAVVNNLCFSKWSSYILFSVAFLELYSSTFFSFTNFNMT